jgi:hypothetical protein
MHQVDKVGEIDSKKKRDAFVKINYTFKRTFLGLLSVPSTSKRRIAFDWRAMLLEIRVGFAIGVRTGRWWVLDQLPRAGAGSAAGRPPCRLPVAGLQL